LPKERSLRNAHRPNCTAFRRQYRVIRVALGRAQITVIGDEIPIVMHSWEVCVKFFFEDKP